jgi:indolepyruvate ferredoxin oxidoreductase, alpha subunit
VIQPRFGIDPEVCTGDHSCMRFNGCPSLTLRENPDPLRDDPIAHVDETCVGCGVCGEVAHAAVLCPSFYEVRTVRNPSRWDRLVSALRMTVIRRLAAIDMGVPDTAPNPRDRRKRSGEAEGAPR